MESAPGDFHPTTRCTCLMWTQPAFRLIKSSFKLLSAQTHCSQFLCDRGIYLSNRKKQRITISPDSMSAPRRGSWFLDFKVRQPHKVTSGRITHSHFSHTTSKRKALNHNLLRLMYCYNAKNHLFIHPAVYQYTITRVLLHQKLFPTPFLATYLCPAGTHCDSCLTRLVPTMGTVTVSFRGPHGEHPKALLNWAKCLFAEYTSDSSTNYDSFLN